MIFKDRQEAGEKLAKLIPEKTVIISLLRGGVVVGNEIAKRRHSLHLPLSVAKISAPYNPELAIGSVCFNSVYLNFNFIKTLDLDNETVNKQIKLAKKKNISYTKRFSLNQSLYKRKLKNKKVVIVDDGIATGSTLKASWLFIKSCQPNKIYLAVPVAPTDFQPSGFDKVFILSFEPFFSAVSQFYESFPQIEDAQVKTFFPNLFRKKKTGRHR